ncbi:jordan transposition protein-like protein [Volvox carteri f. nagariensis]|uniref:Jordan transposition protein-like protein n=1 Tax=Volvox carteri f. nagariensis TaxID=3068 RepID=D8TVX3_VOLCA|nr:jordan transposition protein-like protein [Volvox carteri f. nagariensis]EFJ48381.1 jordan transposition protein-like protein [Volvox carteri f. nagariensis]|eukprot:XP_002950635.1 jordan transposition protein-like protein [Volvox carteri f. nagariensis]
MAPSGTFMQIRDLYLQKRQIGQHLKREVFNFACELAECRAGETFIVIVDGIEWVATVPRRSKPDDLVSMRFSAGNQVEKTLVGMLGSGAREESLKRYIREGLAMKTNEYKERLRGMSHDAALAFVMDHIRHTTPAQGQIGREDNMTYHWPMRPWTRLYDEAASAADRTMTTGNEEALKAGEEVVTSGGAEGGDAAMVDPVKHGGTGDAGEYGVSEDGTEVSGAGQSNGLAPSEAGEQSEELVHRGFGVCNETRKRKRAPNMTRLVADDEEQQREIDRGHNDTDDAAPRYPRMAGQQEEDARGGRAAMPSPRFPCTVRQQEEDARGGEAAAVPSPSAAGRAAMPSPRFPCTEGGASATVQLPPPAPEDARGGEAAAQAADERRRLLPNDEAHLEREIRRMAGAVVSYWESRHRRRPTRNRAIQSSSDSDVESEPEPEDSHVLETDLFTHTIDMVPVMLDKEGFAVVDDPHLASLITPDVPTSATELVSGDKAAAIFQRGDLPSRQGGLPRLTHEGRLRLSNGTGRRMMVKLDKVQPGPSLSNIASYVEGVIQDIVERIPGLHLVKPGSRYYLAEDVAPCRVHILPHPSFRVSCPPVFDRGRLSIEVSTIAGRITVVPVGGVWAGPCRPRACAGAGVTWRYWRTVESLFCKAGSAGWLGGAGGSLSMSSGSARGWCGFFVVVLHMTGANYALKCASNSAANCTLDCASNCGFRAVRIALYEARTAFIPTRKRVLKRASNYATKRALNPAADCTLNCMSNCAFRAMRIALYEACTAFIPTRKRVLKRASNYALKRASNSAANCTLNCASNCAFLLVSGLDSSCCMKRVRHSYEARIELCAKVRVEFRG